MDSDRPADVGAAPPGGVAARLDRSREFQALARALADTVLVLDPDERLAYVGVEAESVFGVPASDLTGRAFRDLFESEGSLPPRVADEHGTWEARLAGGGWVSVASCPMGGAVGGDGADAPANGFEGHTFVFVRSVGEDRVALDRLDLFRRALDGTNNLIVISDATQDDLPIVFVNEHFLDVTEYPREEVVGHNCRFLQVRPDGTRDDDQDGVEALRRAIPAGEAVHVLLRNYTRSGRLFWNDLFVTPIRDGAGRLTHYVGVQNDVTERVEAEAARDAQRQLLGAFYEAAPLPMGVLDVAADGGLAYREVNEALAALYLTTPDALAGRRLEDLGHGEPERAVWEREARACLDRGESRTVRGVWPPRVHPDSLGTRHLTAALTPADAGGVAFVIEDTTEYDRLATSQIERTAALEQAADAVVITGGNLERPGPLIHYVNRAFEEMTGYDRDDVVGKDPRFMQSSLTDRAELDRMRREMEAGRPYRGQLVNERKDGTSYVVEVDIAPLRDAEGAVTGYVSTQRDVTDRRRLEGEVLSAAAQAQEDVARDLHDSVGQVLSGTAYHLHGLAERLEDEGSAFAAEARRAAELVQDAQRQARALAHGLSPVALSADGLTAALTRLAGETAQTYEVACEFVGSAPLPVSPPDRADDLYRIAQEAVANAVRHGRPSAITIRLEPPHTTRTQGTPGDGLGLLAVEDDGVGIADDAVSEGLGLRTMRYRARRLGGSLDVSRRKRGGTAVHVRFPVADGTSLSDEARTS